MRYLVLLFQIVVFTIAFAPSCKCFADIMPNNMGNQPNVFFNNSSPYNKSQLNEIYEKTSPNNYANMYTYQSQKIGAQNEILSANKLKTLNFNTQKNYLKQLLTYIYMLGYLVYNLCSDPNIQIYISNSEKQQLERYFERLLELANYIIDMLNNNKIPNLFFMNPSDKLPDVPISDTTITVNPVLTSTSTELEQNATEPNSTNIADISATPLPDTNTTSTDTSLIIPNPVASEPIQTQTATTPLTIDATTTSAQPPVIVSAGSSESSSSDLLLPAAVATAATVGIGAALADDDEDDEDEPYVAQRKRSKKLEIDQDEEGNVINRPVARRIDSQPLQFTSYNGNENPVIRKNTDQTNQTTANDNATTTNITTQTIVPAKQDARVSKDIEGQVVHDPTTTKTEEETEVSNDDTDQSISDEDVISEIDLNDLDESVLQMLLELGYTPDKNNHIILDNNALNMIQQRIRVPLPVLRRHIRQRRKIQEARTTANAIKNAINDMLADGNLPDNNIIDDSTVINDNNTTIIDPKNPNSIIRIINGTPTRIISQKDGTQKLEPITDSKTQYVVVDKNGKAIRRFTNPNEQVVTTGFTKLSPNTISSSYLPTDSKSVYNTGPFSTYTSSRQDPFNAFISELQSASDDDPFAAAERYRFGLTNDEPEEVEDPNAIGIDYIDHIKHIPVDKEVHEYEF